MAYWACKGVYAMVVVPGWAPGALQEPAWHSSSYTAHPADAMQLPGASWPLPRSVLHGEALRPGPAAGMHPPLSQAAGLTTHGP